MHRIAPKTGCFVSIALSFISLSCSFSPNRYHPDYATHRAAISRVLMLPPEINFFVEMPKDKPVWQDNESLSIGAKTQMELAKALTAKTFDVRIADEPLLQSNKTIHLRALYRNVNRAIQLHTYGPQIFAGKSEQFDYGVGSVAGLLDTVDADALMLIMGQLTVSHQKARTWVSIAVVERSGMIIWYGMQGSKVLTANLDGEAVVRLAQLVLQPFLEGPI